jgi:hypothetical protein
MVRPVIVLQAEHAQLTGVSSAMDDYPMPANPNTNTMDGFFRLQGPSPSR